jgi:hypothetical protein
MFWKLFVYFLFGCFVFEVSSFTLQGFVFLHTSVEGDSTAQLMRFGERVTDSKKVCSVLLLLLLLVVVVVVVVVVIIIRHFPTCSLV